MIIPQLNRQLCTPINVSSNRSDRAVADNIHPPNHPTTSLRLNRPTIAQTTSTLTHNSSNLPCLRRNPPRIHEAQRPQRNPRRTGTHVSRPRVPNERRTPSLLRRTYASRRSVRSCARGINHLNIRCGTDFDSDSTAGPGAARGGGRVADERGDG